MFPGVYQAKDDQLLKNLVAVSKPFSIPAQVIITYKW